MLGIITPIENQPGCSNADCHAHPAEQQILGVLDTNLSLAKADAQLAAEHAGRMIAYTLLRSARYLTPELAIRLARGGRTPQAR